MKTLFKMFMLVALMFAVTNAQDDSQYKNEPGYVDFSALTSFHQGDDITEVFLDSQLLKMMSKVSGKNEPEIKNLLTGLKLIRVYSFDVPKESVENLINKMADVDKKLLSNNWTRIIKVKEKNEYTNVYIKPSKNESNVEGLAVVSLDKGAEASFVNIVGDINLENLALLSDQFNIPMMFKKHHNPDKKVIEEKKVIKEKK